MVFFQISLVKGLSLEVGTIRGNYIHIKSWQWGPDAIEFVSCWEMIPESSFSLLSMWGHNEKVAIYKLGGMLLPGISSTLLLNFQPPKLWGNQFLSFKVLHLWYDFHGSPSWWICLPKVFCAVPWRGGCGGHQLGLIKWVFLLPGHRAELPFPASFAVMWVYEQLCLMECGLLDFVLLWFCTPPEQIFVLAPPSGKWRGSSGRFHGPRNDRGSQANEPMLCSVDKIQGVHELH